MNTSKSVNKSSFLNHSLSNVYKLQNKHFALAIQSLKVKLRKERADKVRIKIELEEAKSFKKEYQSLKKNLISNISILPIIDDLVCINKLDHENSKQISKLKEMIISLEISNAKSLEKMKKVRENLKSTMNIVSQNTSNQLITSVFAHVDDQNDTNHLNLTASIARTEKNFEIANDNKDLCTIYEVEQIAPQSENSDNESVESGSQNSQASKRSRSKPTRSKQKISIVNKNNEINNILREIPVNVSRNVANECQNLNKINSNITPNSSPVKPFDSISHSLVNGPSSPNETSIKAAPASHSAPVYHQSHCKADNIQIDEPKLKKNKKIESENEKLLKPKISSKRCKKTAQDEMQKPKIKKSTTKTKSKKSEFAQINDSLPTIEYLRSRVENIHPEANNYEQPIAYKPIASNVKNSHAPESANAQIIQKKSQFSAQSQTGYQNEPFRPEKIIKRKANKNPNDDFKRSDEDWKFVRVIESIPNAEILEKPQRKSRSKCREKVQKVYNEEKKERENVKVNKPEYWMPKSISEYPKLEKNMLLSPYQPNQNTIYSNPTNTAPTQPRTVRSPQKGSVFSFSDSDNSILREGPAIFSPGKRVSFRFNDDPI